MRRINSRIQFSGTRIFFALIQILALILVLSSTKQVGGAATVEKEKIDTGSRQQQQNREFDGFPAFPNEIDFNEITDTVYR
jgi:hypothetical protein